MGNIDLDLSLAVALQTGAKLVSQSGVRQTIDDLAQVFAHEVLRQFGTVFRPLGF